MRLNDNYEIKELAGQSILVPVKVKNVDFTRVVTLSETAAWLWKEMIRQTDFTVDSLVDSLCQVYDVEEEKAKKDVQDLLSDLDKLDVFEK